jgi:hypothetical protein
MGSCGNLVPHGRQALFAEVFALKIDRYCSVAAEYAGGLVFTKNNAVTFSEDFQAVLVFDFKTTPEFNRDHESAEVVQFSYDADGFYCQDNSSSLFLL